MLKRITIFFIAGISLLKIYAAVHRDLFSDEAFYWQCAQRLDIHFADLPFMTAFFVRLGTAIAGDTLLGIRMFFLLFGLAFPLAVFYLAQPLVGRFNAFMAAGCAVALPLLGTAGIMAVPDVLLWFFTVMFLLGFERATRENSIKFWLLAGFFAAAGLVTHYRFILALLSAFAYLTLTVNGRRQWQERGLWLAILVMLPGFAPTVWYNLRNSFAPLGYFLVDRHGSTIDLLALPTFLTVQGLIVTPLLFAALMLTLVTLARRARKGDDRAALLLIFSLIPILTFFLASPFHDSRLITQHWPVTGYIPLLVFLPEIISAFVTRNPTWFRKTLAALTPALGVALLLVLLLELNFGLIGLARVQRHIYGWQEIADVIKDQHLPEFRRESGFGEDQKPIIVADNYILGANLEFNLHGKAQIYTLDHKRNLVDGRLRQFEIWGTSEASLRTRTGEDALVIVQPRILRRRYREAWMIHVRSLFEQLEPLGDIYIDIPARSGLAAYWMRHVKFSVYRGHRIRVAGAYPVD